MQCFCKFARAPASVIGGVNVREWDAVKRALCNGPIWGDVYDLDGFTQCVENSTDNSVMSYNRKRKAIHIYEFPDYESFINFIPKA